MQFHNCLQENILWYLTQGVNKHLFSQTERRKHSYGGSLERMWAYLTVRQLLDQYLASTDKDSDPLGTTELIEEKQADYEGSSPKARALSLALKVCFITRHSQVSVCGGE